MSLGQLIRKVLLVNSSGVPLGTSTVGPDEVLKVDVVQSTGSSTVAIDQSVGGVTNGVVLLGDDGTVLDWGGANSGDALGVYLLGTKTGGGFNKIPAELNPTTGEIGVNVNVMPYGDPIPVVGTHTANDATGATGLPVFPSVANDTPPSYTEGRMVPLRQKTNGDLCVTLDSEPIASGSNKIGKMSITDAAGSDEAAVGAASNWTGAGGAAANIDPAGTDKLFVSTFAHQLWPASGNRAGISGDGKYYGQLMNDLGDLVISLGSVTSSSGSTQIDVSTGNASAGTPRTVLASDQPRIPAASVTDAVISGTTALTPKFAVIDRTTTGEVVAAVSSKKIRVLSMQFSCATAGKVQWSANSGGTALTGAQNIADKGGFVLPFNPTGWFETGATQNLYVTLTSVTEIDGSLSYVEV
jgi:hypothetical protein